MAEESALELKAFDSLELFIGTVKFSPQILVSLYYCKHLDPILNPCFTTTYNFKEENYRTNEKPNKRTENPDKVVLWCPWRRRLTARSCFVSWGAGDAETEMVGDGTPKVYGLS